jgi:hypothetical protein
LFATGVVADTGGKFASGINNTVDTGGAPRLANCEFLTKIRNDPMTLVLFSGGWGKMIHGKNLNKKIL